MRKHLFLVVALVALLALMVVPVLAQGGTTVVPHWPSQGDTSQSGTVNWITPPTNPWVAVVSNSGTPTGGGYSWTGELLGMAQTDSSGNFTVQFSRPVNKGECLALWYSWNGNGPSAPWTFWDTNGCVVPIPEPGTIYLMGSGILGLLGYAGLKLRSRKSK